MAETALILIQYLAWAVIAVFVGAWIALLVALLRLVSLD